MDETSETAAKQLLEDVLAFEDALINLHAEQETLIDFSKRADRNNIIAVSAASLVTVSAFLFGGSEWLEWYILPLTILMCLLFKLGSMALIRYLSKKIQRMNRLLHHTRTALREGGIG